jgi:hypothetical protein
MGTMIVDLHHASSSVRLHPQFIVKMDNGIFGYTLRMGPQTVGFGGWFPYQRRHWPLAQNKSAFKEFVRSHGLRSPFHATCRSQMTGPYLIKASQSSFGKGIRGPYRLDHNLLPEVALKAGEFYEALVLGKIARAWYCTTELAVLELFDMPTVTGDGTRTFIQLVQDRIGKDTALPTRLDKIAEVQGFLAEDILPAAVKAVADYRYISPLNNLGTPNYNVIPADSASELVHQFKAAGALFYQGIPSESQRNCVFVVDAIVDNSNIAWFLEMNCNSQQHPDIYGTMLDMAFGL